jgi:hypothetical protein
MKTSRTYKVVTPALYPYDVGDTLRIDNRKLKVTFIVSEESEEWVPIQSRVIKTTLIARG